ncbi:MAG: cyclic pyranopterin monophosphate synthase MoaC [Planctomycetota bacterium]
MLSHLDEDGRAKMVDVGNKPATRRRAVAEGFLLTQPATADAIFGGQLPKGSGTEIQAVARTAGILAAKRCGELIPMCHPLPLSSVEIHIARSKQGVQIEAAAAVVGPTGVEMEALAAVTTTALTLYDMAKAIDKTMRIDGVRLLEKSGGQSGDWHADG